MEKRIVARMKLVLRDHIDHLGRRGEIVDVAPGYGRNYLIPKGLAVPATAANMKQLEFERRKFEAQEAHRRQASLKDAELISTKSWTVEAKANEEGHLFGSVTYKDIRDLISAEGLDVDEKSIVLEESDKYPIKERGIYPFKVHLRDDVVAESKLWVVEEAEK